MLKKFKLPRNLTSAVRTYYDTQGALRGNFKHFNFRIFIKTSHFVICARKATRFLKFLKEINNGWKV